MPRMSAPVAPEPPKLDELKLYKAAMAIFESHKYNHTFDEIVTVLRSCEGKPHLAMPILAKSNN